MVLVEYIRFRSAWGSNLEDMRRESRYVDFTRSGFCTPCHGSRLQSAPASFDCINTSRRSNSPLPSRLRPTLLLTGADGSVRRVVVAGSYMYGTSKSKPSGSDERTLLEVLNEQSPNGMCIRGPGAFRVLNEVLPPWTSTVTSELELECRGNSFRVSAAPDFRGPASDLACFHVSAHIHGCTETKAPTPFTCEDAHMEL